MDASVAGPEWDNTGDAPEKAIVKHGVCRVFGLFDDDTLTATTRREEVAPKSRLSSTHAFGLAVRREKSDTVKRKQKSDTEKRPFANDSTSNKKLPARLSRQANQRNETSLVRPAAIVDRFHRAKLP